MADQTLTRRNFLKVAGAGTAGMAVLGASGCSSFVNELPGKLPNGGSKMNVVLVIVDSLRKDHVGIYGNDRIRTPTLDALAAESLRFTDAYPESVPTIPARRSTHTGIRSYPFRNWDPPGEDIVPLWGWQPIPEGQTTLAEILRGADYQTMIISDTLHQFRPFYNFHRGFKAFDWIRGQERDFFRPQALTPESKMENVLVGGSKKDHMQDIMRQYFANTLGREKEEDWFTPQVFLKAAEYLEAASKDDKPFFMVVDSYDPHEPWDPPQKYVDLYSEGYEGPEPMTAPNSDSDWLTGEQLRRMHALYNAEVTMMDRWLGVFLEKFRDLGLEKNTLLLFLSDHGHAFGEHGYVGKVPEALYPEIVDIPFIVRHPEGALAGETSGYYASMHDVAPTILSFLGVSVPESMEGQDLGVIFEGEDPEPRPYFTSAYHDHVWARDDRHVLISRNNGRRAKLFDLEEDPDQNNNIAWGNGDVVDRMYEEYILRDAGGQPLPRY